VSIPEWSDDEMLITCDRCGAPLGTIGELRERLLTALDEDDHRPLDRPGGDRPQKL
jgi:ribosomal protein L34E